MKKVLLVVALLLLATPVFAADVTVTATPASAAGDLVQVTVGYTGAATADAIRAFALSLTTDLDSNAVMSNIRGFKVGESNAISKGYGIFPAKFRQYIQVQNPTTADWSDPNYTPLAEWGDANAGWGINTKWMVVELGTLYQGDANAPGTSGTLFVFDVNNPNRADCNLCIALDQIRGGVVKKDANAATVTLPPGGSGAPPGCIRIVYGPPPTLAAPAQIIYPRWDPDSNVPVYWSQVATATSYELERSANSGSTWANVYTGTATFKAERLETQGANYRYRVRAKNATLTSDYRTGTVDCNAYLSRCYRNGVTSDPNWANWLSAGRPDCWCKASGAQEPNGSGYQCDGDADGATSGAPFNYRVFTGDLTILSTHYKKTAAQMTADPNVNLAGKLKIHAACADIDHKSSGAPFNYRIFTGDLNIVSANYKKINSSAVTATNRLPGNCPR